MPKGRFCVFVFFFSFCLFLQTVLQMAGTKQLVLKALPTLTSRLDAYWRTCRGKWLVLRARCMQLIVWCVLTWMPSRATPRPCLPGAIKVLAVLGAHCQGIAQPAGLGSFFPPLRPSDWGVKSTRTQGRISFSITGLNKLYPNPHQT